MLCALTYSQGMMQRTTGPATGSRRMGNKNAHSSVDWPKASSLLVPYFYLLFPCIPSPYALLTRLSTSVRLPGGLRRYFSMRMLTRTAGSLVLLALATDAHRNALATGTRPSEGPAIRVRDARGPQRGHGLISSIGKRSADLNLSTPGDAAGALEDAGVKQPRHQRLMRRYTYDNDDDDDYPPRPLPPTVHRQQVHETSRAQSATPPARKASSDTRKPLSDPFGPDGYDWTEHEHSLRENAGRGRGTVPKRVHIAAQSTLLGLGVSGFLAAGGLEVAHHMKRQKCLQRDPKANCGKSWLQLHRRDIPEPRGHFFRKREAKYRQRDLPLGQQDPTAPRLLRRSLVARSPTKAPEGEHHQSSHADKLTQPERQISKSPQEFETARGSLVPSLHSSQKNNGGHSGDHLGHSPPPVAVTSAEEEPHRTFSGRPSSAFEGDTDLHRTSNFYHSPLSTIASEDLGRAPRERPGVRSTSAQTDPKPQTDHRPHHTTRGLPGSPGHSPGHVSSEHSHTSLKPWQQWLLRPKWKLPVMIGGAAVVMTGVGLGVGKIVRDQRCKADPSLCNFSSQAPTATSSARASPTPTDYLRQAQNLQHQYQQQQTSSANSWSNIQTTQKALRKPSGPPAPGGPSPPSPLQQPALPHEPPAGLPPPPSPPPSPATGHKRR